MSINHDQAIFDAIAAATDHNDDGIFINVQTFIDTFNGHRDRKLCTSLTKPPPTTNRRSRMNIGEAIGAMKTGKKVSRPSWNGKNMHLYLQTFDGCEPCICMVNAQGGHQPGWLASQPDLLATDWNEAP